MRLPPLRRAIKRVLPTSLFARSLLILLVPLILLQLLVAHIFYGRHWDSVVRNSSNTLAAEIVFLHHEYQVLREAGAVDAPERISAIARQLNIGMQPIDHSSKPVADGVGRDDFPELYTNLRQRLDNPLSIHDDSRAGRIRIRIGEEGGGLVEFAASRKRLASSTTYIFILWMIGSAALLMLVATLFLRNQIRPIVQLARAAEQFGLGHEMVEFTSHRGASEIKRAASAFRVMADRIRRSVGSRTEMLAGISHDLRTPLTRMKLEIEMGKIDQATRDALEADIDEMRAMIDEYLDFARGDAGEPMEPLDLSLLLRDVVEGYARQRRPVTLEHCDRAELMVRPQAMRRALANLIDNALRYGKAARVELEQTSALVRIKVSDSGPGIPEADYETVFKPFTRLEGSRNVKTGGVGLGLSIARDVVQGHGGHITLENQKDVSGNITGLAVTVRLPRGVHL